MVEINMPGFPFETFREGGKIPVRDLKFVEKVKEYVGKAIAEFGRPITVLDIGSGDCYKLSMYTEDADHVFAFEPWQGNVEKAQSYIKGRPIQLFTVDAKEMEKYIGKNEAQIAINQAGPQNEEIIRQVREILVPNGFYVKSAYGLVEPKEALLRFSPGATERERYRALQERAGKRINPHCYEKELDNGGFEITEGPEILTDERECRGREGLMNLAKSPMVLGQSFDHERDRDFLDALSESLRKTEDPSTGELIYTATGRYVFLVARNRKTR